MAYTYRFIDNKGTIIYLGYTGQKLEERMNQHFTKGHLSNECYRSVCKIEYIKWKSKSDAQVMETYYINKYKPCYNKQNKRNDALTIKLDEGTWKLYKEIRPVKALKYQPTGFIWKSIAFIYAAAMVLKLLGLI